MMHTNRDQSRLLVAAGIEPKSADMVYIRGNYDLTTNCYLLDNFRDREAVLSDEYNLPSWSLNALLELIPVEFYHELRKFKGIVDERDENVWVSEVCYCKHQHKQIGRTAVAAVVESILELTGKGFLKKGGKR